MLQQLDPTKNHPHFILQELNKKKIREFLNVFTSLSVLKIFDIPDFETKMHASGWKARVRCIQTMEKE